MKKGKTGERLGVNPLADWAPKTAPPQVPDTENSVVKGLPEGWTRATLIVKIDLIEEIRDIAYWDRRKLYEIVDEIFAAYVKSRKGQYEARPSRR